MAEYGEKNPEYKTELSELASEISGHISDVESVDFPGMYG